jgi:glycosyltransferase involved in cell wall biosynthesis
MTLSAIILTRNEAANIAECIRSVLFADEILVIDDSSTDDTVTIAKSEGAKVLHHPMQGNWGEQRNFAISQASCDTIFFIDADERVTPELAKEIQSNLKTNLCSCLAVRRENHFASGPVTHGILRPDLVTRIFPKTKGSYEGRVHERLVCSLPTIILKSRLIHFPYRDWSHYWQKFDKYTEGSAQKYLEAGKSCSFWRDIILRPIWSFIKIYFFNLGFLDGKLGWIFSMNHYCYTMNKYVRLYSLQKFNGRI